MITLAAANEKGFSQQQEMGAKPPSGLNTFQKRTAISPNYPLIRLLDPLRAAFINRQRKAAKCGDAAALGTRRGASSKPRDAGSFWGVRNGASAVERQRAALVG